MKINLILQINDRDQQYKIYKHKNIINFIQDFLINMYL